MTLSLKMQKNTQQGQALMVVFLINRYGEKLEYAKKGKISIELENQEAIHAMEEIIDNAKDKEELAEMLQKLNRASQKILVEQVGQEKKKKKLIKAIAVTDGINAEIISKEFEIKEFKNLKNIYQKLSIEQLSNCKLNTENEKIEYFQAFKNRIEMLKIIIEASVKKNNDVLEIFEKRYDEFSENLKKHIKIRSHHLKGFFEEI